MPQPEQSEKFVKESLNPGALEAELRYAVDAEVRFDSTSRALYVSDASNYRQVPVGVVIPRTREAVIKTLEICHRHGAPVVSRGGGTSLCGQTCNMAVVLDHSKYLNRVLEVDPDGKFARVEPGAILDHLRNRAEHFNLTFGPDPATHNHNSLGGMIGNNSCGTHSVMAGRTVDNVLELDVITYDGVRMTVGPTSEEKLEAIIRGGGRRGEIYRGLKEIRDRYGDLIRQRYPRIPRRVSGYNLDELLPENGFNVAHALVGTEGTCVTVLEAKLRLVYSPPARSILLLGYPDVFSAADHVTDILKFNPLALEGLDELLVQFIRKKGLHAEDTDLLPAGKGWLVAEFGGRDKKESDQVARHVMAALEKVQSPPAMKLFTDDREEKRVWEMREQGLGATANVPGLPLSWPGWEDAAIAPEKLGGYLREFRKILDGHGLQAALYGHFGDGCIHCRISFDLFTADGVRNFRHFLDDASDLVVKYGGSFSAEHGDGQSKAIFLKKMYGEELIEAFRSFKSLWDPQWKMNPGKIVDPYLPEQNLRFGAQYNPWQPDTHFRFPADGGSFPSATLRCVGVGKCRRTEDAFMCPSFLATRDELHTTRGRAHLLWEMFRGDFITRGWHSKEVMEALEFCLSCKGCTSECPVNVDMPSYKAEFLSHHYRHRLRPPAAYSMGLIGIWARIGSKIPHLANFFLQSAGLKQLAKALGGIAQQRNLPVFADQSFTDWYRSEKKPPEDPDVVLYPDIFNDCFYPGTLRSAWDVLQRFGYRPLVLDTPPPAVRPPMDFGMLDYTKRELMKAVETLSPYVRRGIPVVILEPSVAAVFRDELPNLFPQHLDAERVTKLTFLLSEFIRKERLTPPKLSGRVLLQTHCHQKAVLDGAATRKLLTSMGLHVEEPQSGCCGMAGSFGFEKGAKYDLSMKIAEAALLPAVRTAENSTYIVADGFSCRTQIGDGTPRKALHSADLLSLALSSVS